jgi:hypothetical protein
MGSMRGIDVVTPGPSNVEVTTIDWVRKTLME